jgi:deazaflavin-dependent oxidoreductase (nitroreductase family)
MSAVASYRPSPVEAVRQQVDDYEASAGTIGGTHCGLAVVILTTTGAQSGALRKTPLMRVECAGVYAVVASSGGSPSAPHWYRNLLADPRVTLQDRVDRARYVARELGGGTPEWAIWWDRAVAASPRYAQYRAQLVGQRHVPVVVLERPHGDSGDPDSPAARRAR